MTRTRRALVARREYLCDSIERQRDELDAQLAPWRGRIAALDHTLQVLHRLRRNPLWIAGGVLLLAVAGRRKPAWRWLETSMVAWQLLRARRHH